MARKKKPQLTDKQLRHLIQTLLSQIVDINNNVATVQADEKLDVKDKNAITNTSYYVLTVLSILLHEMKEIAHDRFPDAKQVIDYAMMHYKRALEGAMFKPCQCEECKTATA